ncbi:unnamed protein product [Vicia faba]|uniref:Uncharacterized protein n=1 Tax=Vicia faba TaxID=3906 RepID=A0AAV0ZZF8_VICFA|nr:unnamed protein product [Vicia faba]
MQFWHEEKEAMLQGQKELPRELKVIKVAYRYPDKGLGSRITMKKGTAVHQSLIQWKNKSIDDVTREGNDGLHGQISEFGLEDKSIPMEVGVIETWMCISGICSRFPSSRLSFWRGVEASLKHLFEKLVRLVPFPSNKLFFSSTPHSIAFPYNSASRLQFPLPFPPPLVSTG